MGESPTLVVDNGSYTIKAGMSVDGEPRVVPNCLMKTKSERRKTFIGNQVGECRDLSGLFYIYPHQKGYLVNWDIEKKIWDHVMGRDMIDINPRTTSLLLTEPCCNFPSIQESLNEIAFEEYQFKSFFRCPAAVLSAIKHSQDHPQSICCCVVDVGFSFTHIIPIYGGRIISSSIRRIDIAGKVLTNHLKELISYRQLNVMDETYVINQAKEEVCFVSQDFYKDMELAKRRDHHNTIVRDYVLPDFSHIQHGYVKITPATKTAENEPAFEEQIIRLTNERFSVPELLFHPSDIGIQQCGIPEAVIEAVTSTPDILHPHMYSNILVTGGSAMLPGFRDRVYRDIRALAPSEYDVKVFCPHDPITWAWHGGTVLCKSSQFERLKVTRREFQEVGLEICRRRFNLDADLMVLHPNSIRSQQSKLMS
jgi:actin-related protein 6